ncbi:hypothetical protein SAMN05444166_1163 [Singulisphaera sp. GP187]|uniref:hypothetical protein n=1 Tax=Singulisphaera sp. GP187 TaxID=1882752 RepID=UPI0009296FD4|nr:hypothetical protein [Singulisphaera sp. GP187]SIN83182.1 hypothetical protein SAMN05444166_1163 [Singulisphaera sp. GP187]
MRKVVRFWVLGVLSLIAFGPWVVGQEEELERPAPPALDDFEGDTNKDGVPDGWYNARDVVLIAEGGKVGPHYLKFEVRKPGRPARLSRAFGLDGRKTEAVVIGAWIRLDQIQAGERLGEDPGLMIDFLGEGLRALRRGTLGPWGRTPSGRWTRVSRRIPVPPGTRDAILSVGLLGATGILELDGLTVELVPVGGTESTNLVNNGDFELGDPAPFAWNLENGAHRTFPGFQSDSAIELPKSGARALTGLAVAIDPFGQLNVSVRVRGQGLRGAGGAAANLFFVDGNGRPVGGGGGGANVFRWAGTFDWRVARATVPIPAGAIRAVLQFEKSDSNGLLRVDDVVVSSSPDPKLGAWTPFHVEDDTTGWAAVTPSKAIDASSALDASFLLDAPAGKHGFVTVRDGRLAFSKGGRARFFGVYLLPPSAYLEPDAADALANRLARSGVNLVRLADLDTALGPDRSLYDDTRDDTKVFDVNALARLDHLIAALKARGVYVSLELQSARRFRADDGVANPFALPPGGGPAAEFDPVLGKLALQSAKALLEHVNPETGLALRDDPVLAWVTLAGETSLFDQIERPESLPSEYSGTLRTLASKSTVGGVRRIWQELGEAHWTEMANSLRKDKLRVPIAGVSHWRRDPEFSAQQAAKGFDLIDDRLYWSPPPWAAPERRSLLWSQDGALIAGATHKRRSDRPYVVSQWCHQTRGGWALPYEAADQLLAVDIAVTDDWDALVRRGVFLHPKLWGNAAAGTGGGEDLFQLPEVVNGMPQIFALWPHAASMLLRSGADTVHSGQATRTPLRHRTNRAVAGWEPKRGRLVIETPFTQGLAGWPGGEAAVFEHLVFETDQPYAVLVASSVGSAPIATTKRLLVTAVARVEPTGFRWVDELKVDVAEPGTSPLLQEPIRAKVLWRHKGNVKAYPLDNNGTRGPAVPLVEKEDGLELTINGSKANFHWELVEE